MEFLLTYCIGMTLAKKSNTDLRHAIVLFKYLVLYLSCLKRNIYICVYLLDLQSWLLILFIAWGRKDVHEW